MLSVLPHCYSFLSFLVIGETAGTKKAFSVVDVANALNYAYIILVIIHHILKKKFYYVLLNASLSIRFFYTSSYSVITSFLNVGYFQVNIWRSINIFLTTRSPAILYTVRIYFIFNKYSNNYL